jgi:hypothetical protein
LCIEEVHLTLTRAAQSAFGFFAVAGRERVYIIHRPTTNDYVTIDRQTYQAYRGTMKYSACTIIFYGGLTELSALAAGVPPSLFSPADAAAAPKQPSNHQEF